ncbi:hypothetical protein TrST_g8101 [Triparma strigata]|uniref:Uncharacterized protein n=1 Tax=Triparma strigata TaxID=1606541 RepID=A0A9W7F4F5_9STRA|nr:hypothetical protein TrST_g8101 [Triparma strigata]
MNNPMASSTLNWLEMTAAHIKETKLRVAGLYCVGSVLLILATYLGTNLLLEHNFSSVYQKQSPQYPSPLTTPFTLCSTSTVVNVAFPSKTIPTTLTSMLHSILPARCNWLASTSHHSLPATTTSTYFVPQTVPSAPAPLTKVNSVFSLSTLSIRYPDTAETLCPSGLCLSSSPYGQCTPLSPSCVYIWLAEEPISRMIGLYNLRCKLGGDYTFAEDPYDSPTCPDADVYEFARKIGNVYTKEFSKKYVRALNMKGTQCVDEGGSYEEECTPSLEPTTDYMYHKAYMEVMKHVIVVPVTDAVRGVASLSYLLGVKENYDVNKFKNRYKYTGRPGDDEMKGGEEYWTPSKKQREKLAVILQHDVKLYNRAVEIYESKYKGWKPKWDEQ